MRDLTVGWKRLPQLLIGRRRELVQMRQEGGELPDLIVAVLFTPSGHAGPTDPVLDDVEVLVIGHVGRIHPELRRGRIEGLAEPRGHVDGIAVASGATGAIEAGAGAERVVGGLERILHLRSVTVS